MYALHALDDLAQILVLHALIDHLDGALLPHERCFLYMPLMHAESVALQRLCMETFHRLTEEARPVDREAFNNNLNYAVQHAETVERFGRFPHRNEILGRASTPEELAFLQEPGSSF